MRWSTDFYAFKLIDKYQTHPFIMKRILLLCFLLSSFLTNTSQAQHMEAGIIVGASTYQGDLAPSELWLSITETHPAFGVFGRYNFSRLGAIRLGVNYLTISGDDAKSDDAGRASRNLSFRSSILEFSLIGEWNILGYQPYGLEETFSPYFFGGISVFKFNPKAKYEGDWYELQPLGTEGQNLAQYPERTPYKLTQFSIPIGFGAKYAINDTWNIGVEFGARKTFTDYLDDVSTTYVSDVELLEGGDELAAALANRTGEPKATGFNRGDPEDDDWYLFGGVTISINFLDNGLVGFRGRNSKKSGCPTF